MNQSPEAATVITPDATYYSTPTPAEDSTLGTIGIIGLRILLVGVVVVVKLAILASMK